MCFCFPRVCFACGFASYARAAFLSDKIYVFALLWESALLPNWSDVVVREQGYGEFALFRFWKDSKSLMFAKWNKLDKLKDLLVNTLRQSCSLRGLRDMPPEICWTLGPYHQRGIWLWESHLFPICLYVCAPKGANLCIIIQSSFYSCFFESDVPLA